MIKALDDFDKKDKPMKYDNKDINSMILFLRVKRIAEFYYVGDNAFKIKHFDYMSRKKYKLDDMIEMALSGGWAKGWVNDEAKK